MTDIPPAPDVATRRIAVPNSSATARPRTAAPADACDAHIHIFDKRFAQGANILPRATVQDYRELQALTGTVRAVVVQPRACGVDNTVTLDAIRQLGPDRTRGVAVVLPDVTDAELDRLHEGGIRGIRFSLYVPRGTSSDIPKQSVVSFDMVETLAHRVQALGWHVQLHWTADQIARHQALLDRLPTPMVFDHLARLPLPEGTAHPAFGIVRALLQQGRAWIKLSAAYHESRVGAAGGYEDIDPIMRAWVRASPDRLVWGSDWPHPGEDEKPDDVLLFDMLARAADDQAIRRRILVDNPAALYGFPSA